jgi:outer membrane protein OmpA-like peptidoglycan-associated protein
MRARTLTTAALAAACCASPSSALAQQTKVQGFALDAFDPSVPVDAFFGVPSPAIGGHLEVRGTAMFDFSSHPFNYRNNITGMTTHVVGSQGLLRVDASLALWDRLLVSVDVPFALVNSGSDPKDPKFDFHPPSGPAMGDVRVGLRGRIWGEFRDPFQIGVSANLYAPSGSAAAYMGEGHVRGAFQLLLGGRAGGFVWSAAGGTTLRATEAPLATFGGGVGWVFGDDRVQIGPEAYGSVAIGGPRHALPFTNLGSPAEIEILGGARVRLVGGLYLGAAAGTGPIAAIDSPAFRFLGSISWAPIPAAPSRAAGFGDRDGDGIADDVDACPDVPGELQSDPAKDGCPIADKDHDGVLDVDDACPDVPGASNADPTKNGCPLDSDEDGIPDTVDACPREAGVTSTDPKKNGCPSDRDGDGVADAIDACPDAPGVKSADPKQNGCPDDPDGDGIKGAADACPLEKGLPDPDPKQNGCPKFVRVANDQLEITTQIQFKPYGIHKSETIAPVSAGLMNEIRDVIAQHPEIVKLEVQGHTDDMGTDAFNLHLSQERADAVRQWLVDAGIPADKLVAKGYGMWKPTADNRVRNGRTRNRRVQFVILEKKK